MNLDIKTGIIKNILVTIAILMSVLGIGFFITTNLIEVGVIDFSKELPISSSISGIIVNEKYIYIGMIGYNRVQQYDINGHFVKAHKMDNYRKSYTFHINNNYLPIIDKQDINEPYNSFENPYEFTFKGYTYKLKDRYLRSFYSLIREKKNKQDIIIENAFWTIFLTGEGNVLMPIEIVGILILAFIYRNRIDKMISQRGTYNGQSQSDFFKINN